MSPRKSHPKGIDPASPNKNFVKASYENHNDMDGYYKYMYGDNGYGLGGQPVSPQGPKTSGFGHGIGQRAGKLRTSGNPRAHRIGKR